MTDQELLLAISDIMDKKIKSELQPVRDDIKALGQRMDALEQRIDARMDALEQRIDARMDGLETRMSAIELRVYGLEQYIYSLEQRIDARIDTLEQRMDGLETRIHTIEMHLENVTDKNIQLLAENYLPAAKRYENSTAAIEAIQVDIDLMKGVIRNHSEQLQQLS